MAHRCVPVVVRLGGQLEIVQDGASGRLWGSVAVVAITRVFMSDREQARTLGEAAFARASRFGKASFVSRIRSQILEPAGVHAG